MVCKYGLKCSGVTHSIESVKVQAEQDSEACSTTTMETAAWQLILCHCMTMFPPLLS